LTRKALFALSLAILFAAGIWSGRMMDRPVPPVQPRTAFVAAEHESRSSKWPAVRRAHLEREPACIFCGKTTDLQVHHVLPVHLHPEKELDPNNLCTLCGPGAYDCHFLRGHLGGWNRFNPAVREDAARYRAEVEEAKKIAEAVP
jgi:hypothetical protein